jgi:hypothetical protein
MRNLISAISVLVFISLGIARGENSKGKHFAVQTVRLESSAVELNQVTLVLHDDAEGVYHHFILEKSHDGVAFFEVARSESSASGSSNREIKFKDNPFEKSGVHCIFYRVRAVDELGWFDFTNTVSIMKQDRIARKEEARPEQTTGGSF